MKRFNDRGHYEINQNYIYLYRFKAQLFILLGDNDEHKISLMSRLKHEPDRLIHKSDFDRRLLSEGRLFGDFDHAFLASFFTNWHDLVFKRKEVKYELHSCGLVGEAVNEELFKAKFYNCFGEVIFDECNYHLIYEGDPQKTALDNN
ncbi:hypothetical protein [Croceiramulus getboli]|nr:hypothetical protein P8624_06600 [Flavobacteriaceae bacterium YJPT1-3]